MKHLRLLNSLCEIFAGVKLVGMLVIVLKLLRGSQLIKKINDLKSSKESKPVQ
jgi:hypothetical protein